MEAGAPQGAPEAGELSMQDIAQLQERVAPVAAISDEFWYLERFGQQPVYVLQIVVAPELKGTGAFHRLVDPVIAACDAAGLPMVRKRHNCRVGWLKAS